MRTFSRLSIGLLISIFAATGSANMKNIEIINGTPATTAHPQAASVVGLLTKYSNHFNPSAGSIWIQSCTGSVYGKRLILTAAHCVESIAPSSLAINFSLKTVTFEQQQNPATRITDLEKHFTIRKVKNLVVHPNYDGSGSHDLALIALTEDIPSTAVPVTLLPQNLINKNTNQTSFEGHSHPVLLMGFGLVNEDTQQDSDILRYTTVSARFENNLVITDQTKGTGGCNGDSGGPAFLNYQGKIYQVGVTHGPHSGSFNCKKEGEWNNPALDLDFLNNASSQLK